eukprot:m.5970 g.5970  ORF g.5970 m.5970 type:complete len:173 (+) comp3454_c0_seq1:235-753(+)
MAANTKAAIDRYRKEGWFHGSIPRTKAEEKLETKMVGTFLFREAESRAGLSLSVRGPDRIKHFMISQKDDGKWFLVGKPTEFEDIYKLIQFHEKTPTSTADGLLLKYACPLEESEGIYVQPEKDSVNQNVIEDVAKSADRKRSSLTRASEANATGAPPAGGKHAYEFVAIEK